MKELINIFGKSYLALHQCSVEFIEHIQNEQLFWIPSEKKTSLKVFSCGEYILRSARTVEQTFGGITTKLWDDPFEWTLPEELSNKIKIFEYLNEVEKTRLNGFGYFRTDEDLYKQIPAPKKLKPIAQLLLETIARAEHFQGRAMAVWQFISDEKIPINKSETQQSKRNSP